MLLRRARAPEKLVEWVRTKFAPSHSILPGGLQLICYCPKFVRPCNFDNGDVPYVYMSVYMRRIHEIFSEFQLWMVVRSVVTMSVSESVLIHVRSAFKMTLISPVSLGDPVRAGP